MYSDSDIKFENLAPLGGKSTGIWHECTDESMYWSLCRQNFSRIKSTQKFTRTKRSIHILISNSKNWPLSMWNRQENETCKWYIRILTETPKICLSLWGICREVTRMHRRIIVLILISIKKCYVWEYSNKIDTENYTIQMKYSYTELKLKQSAILRGKSTGKWHEPKEIFVYWTQTQKTGPCLWRIERKMTRIHGRTRILNWNSRYLLLAVENQQAHETNPRKNSCTDRNLEIFFMSLRIIE